MLPAVWVNYWVILSASPIIMVLRVNGPLGIAVKVPIYWGVKADKPLSPPNIWALSRELLMTCVNSHYNLLYL